MTSRGSSAGELEEDVDRARLRVGATIVQLRSNLSPRNLAEEIARESGIQGISATDVVEYCVKRHPIPTLLIGVGAGILAFSLARSHRKATNSDGEALRDAAASLARSATDVFRDRAQRKRQEFMGAAKPHIEAGASHISDIIGKGVDNLVGQIPANAEMRPVIQSAIQTLLFTALNAILPRPR